MEQVTEGIWAAEKDFRLPGGVVFRSRMTVIDVGDGELLLHSPVDVGDQLAELDEVGEVRWIVAPSDLHDSDFDAAVRRFPNAKLVAPAKVREARPHLEFAAALEEGPGLDGLDSVTLTGAPRWNETVFVHRASGSLICSDFVFNVQTPPNFLTGLVLRMVGCHRCFAQSRSVRYLFVRDRAAFGASVAELMEYDFDRIIMCHGDVVHSGGRALIEREVAWVRGSRPALLEAQ